MNTTQLFEQISSLYETAKTNHEGKFKTDKQKARKALSELKKVIAAYNKASVVESKIK